MDLTFDLRGNLKPYDITELTLDEFEKMFVLNFDSQKRIELFEEYKRYTTDLYKVLNAPFYQWINGSFIGKKEKPNDIDLVSFIAFELYNEHKNILDKQFAKFSVRKFYKNIDAYLVYTYPEEHKFYDIYKGDRIYWQNTFGQTRFNRAKKRFPKGFVKIIIF